MIDVLHFFFTVSDLNRSVAWYVDTLGLELVARPNASASSALGLEVGLPGSLGPQHQLSMSGARLQPV